MTIMPDTTDQSEIDGFVETTERVRTSTTALNVNAPAFARVMSRAFADATTGGKQFEDVLKQMALRLSNMAVAQAFKPVARGLSGSLSKIFEGLFGGGIAGKPPVSPFAAGGVIGAPSYFPLASGGLGLAGEAGPEAIMPLERGADGRLGVAASGGGAPANINVHIAVADAESFRRSEAYITGQIAHAVARGQRGF